MPENEAGARLADTLVQAPAAPPLLQVSQNLTAALHELGLYLPYRRLTPHAGLASGRLR